MSNSFIQKPEELENFLEFFEEDKENIRRVKNFCQEKELNVEFEIHPKAETCEESAEYSDIDINQIIKTLVFKAGDDFIAVLAPGDKRVDTDKIRKITDNDNVRMANPKEVEENTGYVIGGVSPFDLNIPVYMEEQVLEHDKVRPAGGSRIVGVEIDPDELKDLTICENVCITD